MTVPSDRKEAIRERVTIVHTALHGDVHAGTAFDVILTEYATVVERYENVRDQFAWIAREAAGDCDPDRIIRACQNALDVLNGAALAGTEESA